MMSYFRVLRPYQWIKNGFVFAPLLFSANYTDTGAWILAFIAFISFCLVSSSVYILNDIKDVKSDRLHPQKKKRPLASGELRTGAAFTLSVSLFLLALLLSFALLPLQVSYILLAYLGIQVSYTLFLKDIAIVDVFVISSGFVLRLFVGACAIDVLLSPWIIVCTYFSAIFLGFNKRAGEIYYFKKTFNKTVEAQGAVKPLNQEKTPFIRNSLKGYNLTLLSQFNNISACATIVSYALYCVEMGHRIEKPFLIFTLVFVVFGFFRYLQFVTTQEEGEQPEIIIFQDRVFLLNMVLWLSLTLWILKP